MKYESGSYIAFVRVTAAMGLGPKKNSWVVGIAMIDTGSNVVYSVGIPLLSATRVVNMQNVKPVFGQKLKHFFCIGQSTRKVGILKFYFLLEGREQSVDLNIVPGATPLTASCKDLDSMSLNYQTLYKTTGRPEEGYEEKVEKRHYLLFLTFPKYFFLSAGQLRNMQRSAT